VPLQYVPLPPRLNTVGKETSVIIAFPVMSEMQEVNKEVAFTVYDPVVSKVQLMDDPVPGTGRPFAIPFLNN